MRVINVHTHFHPDGMLEKAAQWGVETGTDADGTNYLRVGDYILRGIKGGPRKTSQLAERVAKMDEDGVDVQLLQISPLFYLYWVDAEINAHFAQIANDGLAEARDRYPDRFWIAAHVPLQSVDLAIQELDRAVNQLDAKAVNIGVNIDNRSLDDPYFDPFYEAVVAHDIPLMIHPHPLGIDVPDQKWMKNHDVDWNWGYIFEESAAVVDLIFGGVLDRFPGLRVMVPHGGGSIPFQIGRLQYQVRQRPGGTLARPLEEYFRQLWFDTCVHDPRALRYLIDIVGVDRVVLGTNYPGWDHFPGWEVIRKMDGLTEEQKQAILGRNAEYDLFRIHRNEGK